jgi:hypothetical protein
MRSNQSNPSRGQPGLAVLLAVLVAAATGCAQPAPSGVVELADDPALAEALAADGAAVNLSVQSNGLATNGISQNGISQNGISQNGLTATGLTTTAFTSWFNLAPVLADVVMRYTYRCAAPAGTAVTWRNPSTGVRYTWDGGLGLAPGWTAGSPATLAEQQVVTACLVALTNKYGVSITLAVEGRTAAGVQLAVTAQELKTYPVREGCFFGNLFAAGGLFAGIDHPAWPNTQSSARACAFDNTREGMATQCPPIVFVGACADFCTPDASKTFYERCTYGGVTYQPLVTRLKPADIYKCGDEVCQFTEACGTKTEWWNCRDCGACR